MCEILNKEIKEKGLVDKSDISEFIGNSALDKKIVTLATKAELKSEQDKIVKLEELDSGYFCGNTHFEIDGTQNHLVFQPGFTYLKTVANKVTVWKSKGLSDESNKPPSTSDNSLNPVIGYIGNVKKLVKFDGDCLK